VQVLPVGPNQRVESHLLRKGNQKFSSITNIVPIASRFILSLRPSHWGNFVGEKLFQSLSLDVLKVIIPRSPDGTDFPSFQLF